MTEETVEKTAEEKAEPKPVKKLTAVWTDDGRVHIDLEPPESPHAILGLLVLLVKQLGG